MSRPSKRYAESDPEDDDRSRSLSETISSTPPSGGRKRRRISDDSILEDGDVEDREDTPPSDYESGSEEDEVAATQAIRRKRAEQNENEPAECGILESVQLYNFMCHKKYEYKMGPLINFVCGKNGSGKSAILTAIVLCLGGKASATNRGGSLKSFIKEGEESATIVCRIKNCGEGAYLPEDFGETIQVERHFTRNGTSGFKIKSQSGRIVSSKRADLDEICDHFALQIDNPLNVLSQDMARQFITTSNASEKYRFFVKGVQLEQLDQDYRLIEDQLENIKVNIEKKRPDIKDLERTMEQARAKDEAMKKTGGLRSKMKDLRRQIAWVQVEAQEKILAEYVDTIKEADHGITQQEETVIELDQAFQSFHTSHQQAEEAFDRAKIALQEVKDEKTEKVAQRDDIKRETMEANAELRSIRSELEAAKATITAKSREIGEEEARLADIQGGGAADRIRALDEAKQASERASRAYEIQHERAGDLKDAEAQAKMDMQSKAKTADEMRRSLQDREHDLKDFMANQDHVDAAYDRNMPNLVRTIAQDKRFKQRPVGPIGKHVRLRKPEWSSILEKSLGSSLSGFVVTNKSDSTLLHGIMKRVGCVVPILIGNDHPIDTTGHEPDERFDTILRVLDIDSEIIRKQLIIQQNIEQFILIPDLKEATEIMYSPHAPGNFERVEYDKLKNVKRCFCLNPQNKRNGFSLSYTRGGKMSQDPVHEFAGKPKMKSDNQAQIRMREEAVEEARGRRRDAEAEHKIAMDHYVQAGQNLKRHLKLVHDLKVEYQRCDDAVESLNEAIKDDNVESGKLDTLRQLLAEAEGQKSIHEESFKDAVVGSDEKKTRLSEVTRGLDSLDVRIDQAEKGHRRAQQVLADSDKKRAYALGQKNEGIARLNDAKEDRAAMDEKRAEMELKIEDWINQATAISPRVNIPEGATQKSLEDQHNAIRADVERYTRTLGGTEEQIAQAARSAKDAFKKGKKDLEKLEQLSEKLTTSLLERQQRWKKFRSHISVRAKAMFTFLLSERSFRGKLITDHKQKLLELSVEPDITRREGGGRSARTLSGGEKSFSQICLLLSIWEAMGSPIRCLDEFDVFMDPVNRNLSVNLLIEAARQSVGRQFVLISPGTKEDIQRADDIQAMEVAAPERGQRTIQRSGAGVLTST